MFSSFSVAMSLIKLFQMFEFFTYLNINLPSNVASFIAFFDLNIYGIFPDFVTFDESELECNLHPILQENGISCLAVNNIFDMILQLSALLLFKIFLSTSTRIIRLVFSKKSLDNSVHPEQSETGSTISRKRLRKTKKNEEIEISPRPLKYFYKVLKVLNDKIDASFYWAIFISMEVDLFLGAWTSLKGYTNFTFPYILSMIILIFCVLHILIYTIIITRGFFVFYVPTKKAKSKSKAIKRMPTKIYNLKNRRKYPKLLRLF